MNHLLQQLLSGEPHPSLYRLCGVGYGGFIESELFSVMRCFAWFPTMPIRRCLLTACPSNSTAQMLQGRGVDNVRIWSRGVDLELFGPHRRNPSRRERWGIKICARTEPEGSLAGFIPKNTVLPLTPPPSPDLLPVGDDPESDNELAVLYVGRMYVMRHV